MTSIEHDNDASLAGFLAGWDKRLQENEQLRGFPSNRGDFVIRILFLLPVLP
jgi:hypothetical protein